MTILMKSVGTLVITLAFAATTAGPPMMYMAAPDKAPIEITVRVAEKGFLD